MNRVLAPLIVILELALINGSDLLSSRSLATSKHYNNLIKPSYLFDYRHPCNRKCVAGRSYTCYWYFVLHYYEAAGTICTLSNNNPSLGCIRADGVPTQVMATNYQVPGPYMEICEGDTVVVDVFNLLKEPTTVHWHGLHLRKEPFMDGAPMVTQYPIKTGELFRYKFAVEQYGTYWWHSHVMFQRAFGISGPLIVRQHERANQHAGLYDKDLSEHIIHIEDWFVDYDISKVTNILINGQGYNHNAASKRPSDYHRFNVDPNKKYRFRMIYNGNANCPVEISIENHEMLVISVDSIDIQPVSVASIIMLSSERVDFVLHTTKPIANYWLRVRGFNSCGQDSIHQGAVIHYNGASKTGLPANILSYEGEVEGVQLNPRDTVSSSDPNLLTMLDLNGLQPNTWNSDQEFKTYYSSFGIIFNGPTFSLVMDNIRYAEPPLSLLQSRHLGIESGFCNKTSLSNEGRDCTVDLCECTHIIQVPAYEHVEFVISAETPFGHPVHIHGMFFKVVGMGILGENDIKRIKDIDAVTPLPRRMDDNPVSKDTVQVPGFGYVIIRVKTDNPGFWMYHCHLAVHSENGMRSVLKVGTNEQMIGPPRSFGFESGEFGVHREL